MPERLRSVSTVCATTPGERVMRAVLAVLAAGVATSMWSTRPWCAVPAAICTAFLVVGAATGWCPTSLLPAHRAAEPTHGYPDASGIVDLTGRSRERRGG